MLIDFIHHGRGRGPVAARGGDPQRGRPHPAHPATAGTTLLGNWVITLDPIFSGLAWAIIFGIFTSTVFTLVVIPVVYWLLYGGKEAEDATAGS